MAPLKTVKENSNSGYKCRKNCKATYISKDHIKRLQEKKKNESSEEEPQRRLRSNVHTSSFVWKEHCLFCAEDCKIKRDKKHPDLIVGGKHTNVIRQIEEREVLFVSRY